MEAVVVAAVAVVALHIVDVQVDIDSTVVLCGFQFRGIIPIRNLSNIPGFHLVRKK